MASNFGPILLAILFCSFDIGFFQAISLDDPIDSVIGDRNTLAESLDDHEAETNSSEDQGRFFLPPMMGGPVPPFSGASPGNSGTGSSFYPNSYSNPTGLGMNNGAPMPNYQSNQGFYPNNAGGMWPNQGQYGMAGGMGGAGGYATPMQPSPGVYGNQWANPSWPAGLAGTGTMGQTGNWPSYPSGPGMPSPSGQSSSSGSSQTGPKCGVRRNSNLLGHRRKRHLFYQLMKNTWPDEDPEGTPIEDSPGAARFSFGGNSMAEDFDSSNENSYHNNNDQQEETPRIVGGRVSNIGFWPWQVSLRYNEGHVCGGSIVSQRYILTATHCFREASRNPADWTVYAGKSKLALGEPGEVGPIRVESITTNPNYGKLKRFDSDIALIRLQTPLRYSDRVAPICLPQQGAVVQDNMECFITGYGETKGTGGDGYLKEAMVPIISPSRCAQASRSVQRELTQNMICAGYDQGGIDSCQGDSGGPLVCRSRGGQQFIQQGVVSFGFGCAGKNSPGIYARTANFVQWIKHTVQRQQRRRKRATAASTPLNPYFLANTPKFSWQYPHHEIDIEEEHFFKYL